MTTVPERHVLEREHGGYWRYPITDFLFLRNLHFPPPALLAELSASLPELLWSYGSRQATLDALLADFIGCDAAHVVALAGLSQVYPWLASELLGRGPISHAVARIGAPAPTFGEYERVLPGHATYRDDFALGAEDLAALSRRAAHALDVVIFVNPNNPTGTVVPSADILRFSDEHPRVRVIVDESFLRFSSEPSLVGALEAHARENVVVLASLSKDLGMPGLRLGFAYSRDAAFVGRLRAALPIWNLSALAEHVLERLRDHRDALADSLRATRADRAGLAMLLGASLDGVTVREGGANFVVTSFACDAATASDVADRLLRDHRILVKDISPKVADGRGHFRLAVRREADHRALAAALGEHLRALSGRRDSDSGC